MKSSVLFGNGKWRVITRPLDGTWHHLVYNLLRTFSAFKGLIDFYDEDQYSRGYPANKCLPKILIWFAINTLYHHCYIIKPIQLNCLQELLCVQKISMEYSGVYSKTLETSGCYCTTIGSLVEEIKIKGIKLFGIIILGSMI